MKILLINATSGMFFVTSKHKTSSTGSSATPPLGLLYIAASLEKNGHSIELIDYYSEKNPEKKINQSCISADAVGLNVYTTNYKKIVNIVNKIKIIDSDIPIIIGGPHCTFHPNKALSDIPNADISVEGEGEFVINDIINSLNGTKKLCDLPGVFYRVNGEIKNGKPLSIIKDLDSITLPSRHLVEKYTYGQVGGIDIMKQKFTTIMTSRGCPHRCRFCNRDVPTMKTYRERSVENVMKELEEINDKYKSVMFVDDNFTGNKRRINKIMDLIIQNKLDLDISITGARVDSANRDLFKKMKKAGVKSLFFGIESGNQDVLNFYNKGITINQINKAVNLSYEMNFFTVGNFILGAPIETRDHIEKTIDFSCSLPLDVAVFTPLFYEIGSELWKNAYDQGLINDNDEYIIMADKRRGLSKFTHDELVDFSIEASKRYYRRPSYFLRELIQIIKRRDFHLLKIGFYLI